MINQTYSSHTEMVNLESYDSEGPHTPETDDSAEVSALVQSCTFCVAMTKKFASDHNFYLLE